MAQCFHLDSHGRRCRREIDEESYFCGQHSLEASFEAPPLDLRKLGFRLAAFVLLVVFLLPLMVQVYRFVREMLKLN